MVTKVRAGSRLLRLSSLRRLSRCLQLLFLAVLATAFDLTDPARRGFDVSFPSACIPVGIFCILL